MFCPECGAKQPEDDAKYCLKCGASLISAKDKGAEPDESQAVAIPAAGAAESPASASPQPQSQTQKPNMKIIGIASVAAVIVVAIVVAAFVVPSCNAGEKPAVEPTSQEPAPTGGSDGTGGSEGSDQPDFEAFVGSWVAQDSSDDIMTKEWFEAQAEAGVYVTLDLEEDGTGAFNTDSGAIDITWKSESASLATVTAEGGELKLELKSAGSLTMINGNGTEIYFVPASSVNMSNPGGSSTGSDGSGTDSSGTGASQQPTAGMQVIGNAKVGYMQVPSSWTDRTSDLDPNAIEAYGSISFADASTEFVSGQLGHFAFAESVQMSAYDTDYKSVASQYAAMYVGDGYGEFTDSPITVGGHDAVLLVSSVPADNLNVATVVIDRDGKSSVSITLNCGAIGAETKSAQIVSYATTWTVS